MPLIDAVASRAIGIAEVSCIDIESAIGICLTVVSRDGICISRCVESPACRIELSAIGIAMCIAVESAGAFVVGRFDFLVTARFFAGDFAFFVLSLVPIGMFMGIGGDFLRAESAA